jgi:ABC-type oligopeptide transport system substrate-binding subunit
MPRPPTIMNYATIAYLKRIHSAMRNSPHLLPVRSLIIKKIKPFTSTYTRKQHLPNQQPITASDAVASIEHLIHKGPLKYHHLSTYKLKFSATRPNLITIESKQTIPFSLLIQIGLLPITQKNSLNHPNPIESGPYQRDFYKKNAFHQLKKNRLYWKNTVQQAWSFPQFDTIKIIYVKSNSTALELFKRQDIDYLWEPTLEHWQNLQKLATKNPHLQLQSIPVQRPISMKGLAFNLYNPLFNNVKIRQALQLAFDFDSINQHLFNHTYQRINSYMTHTPYQQEQVNPPVYNLEKADQLLNESGWILDNGRRIHHKTRQPLTIHILVNNHHNEKISILYQNSLKNLGISASIQRSTQADYPQRIQQGNFDLAYYVISNTHLTCEKTIQHFIKSNNNHMNYANLFHSEDPTIKAKFQAMTQLTSWSEKQALLKQMDKHLIEQHYFIPFWYAPNDHIAHWDSIKGSQVSFQITPLNNFKHWKPHSQHSPEPQT